MRINYRTGKWVEIGSLHPGDVFKSATGRTFIVTDFDKDEPIFIYCVCIEDGKLEKFTIGATVTKVTATCVIE